MAELSTIARPYAVALFKTYRSEAPEAALRLLDGLAQVVTHPEVAAVLADPRVTKAQVVALIQELARVELPEPMQRCLHLLVDNQRLEALPEIVRQFQDLNNVAKGMAECVIESAFELSEAQAADLIAAVSKRFGLKLKPEVRVVPELVGGVRVSVGDHVLDTSVKTQLAHMRAALTAA